MPLLFANIPGPCGVAAGPDDGDDGYLDEEILLHAFQVSSEGAESDPALEEFRLENYYALNSYRLARYLKRIKYEQQRIIVLANTSNDTIRSHPKTLSVVNESLAKYRKLLDGANFVESSISVLELEDDVGREHVANLRRAFRHLSWEREKLTSLVKELEAHQAS